MGVTVVETTRTRILREIYGKIVGSVVMYAACIGQKQKLCGTNSALRAGQVIGSPLSIHFRENFRIKKSRAAK